MSLKPSSSIARVAAVAAAALCLAGGGAAAADTGAAPVIDTAEKCAAAGGAVSGNRCFYAVRGPGEYGYRFGDAREACAAWARGATLAVIPSDADSRAVASLAHPVRKIHEPVLSVGLNWVSDDAGAGGGRWEWADGEPYVPGQPPVKREASADFCARAYVESPDAPLTSFESEECIHAEPVTACSVTLTCVPTPGWYCAEPGATTRTRCADEGDHPVCRPGTTVVTAPCGATSATAASDGTSATLAFVRDF